MITIKISVNLDVSGDRSHLYSSFFIISPTAHGPTGGANSLDEAKAAFRTPSDSAGPIGDGPLSDCETGRDMLIARAILRPTLTGG